MPEIKLCPYCNEEINLYAKKCKHCGEWLDDSSRPTSPPSYSSTDPRTHVTLALANRFELLEEIGKGGMAVVYKARQKNLDRIVALKVIHQNLIHDSEFLERFHREARIASSLSHPNIVTIHDEGIENGVHFIAMEYLEGVDLHSLIKRKGKLKEEETIKIIIPIAEALDYAHSKQVIHRDIKSANIIITATGRAVLVDFGIAHAAAGTKLSQTGTVFGTPEYMSPEQADGKAIDHRSDLYSLGVVMYESLTGEVPFKGDNPLTTIYKILNSTHSPIKLYSGNDEWINTVISKALTKDRAYRFNSGRELSEVLKNRKKVWNGDKNDIKTENKVPPKTTYQPPQGSTIKMPGDIPKKENVNSNRIRYVIGAAIIILGIILLYELTKGGGNEKKIMSDMVYVEGGTFEMGSSDGDNDEKPVHQVTVSSFYIDKYEVTQREYEEVMGNNPSYNKCSECPVENVSWEEANEYARKIGKRLPTEAEWEYAARGGNKSKGYRYSGSNDIDDIAWYGGNSSNQTHKVGTKKANEIGIYDMSGNVWEWCSDWYDRNYYDKSPSQNPEGPRSGTYRVLRGGSWLTDDFNCRVSNRNWDYPSNRNYVSGFRCSR